jgi:hypothetical protein
MILRINRDYFPKQLERVNDAFEYTQELVNISLLKKSIIYILFSKPV